MNSGVSSPENWRNALGKSSRTASTSESAGFTKTATGAIVGGARRAISCADSNEMRRGDGAKIIPNASAPASAAIATSPSDVHPQHLIHASAMGADLLRALEDLPCSAAAQERSGTFECGRELALDAHDVENDGRVERHDVGGRTPSAMQNLDESV